MNKIKSVVFLSNHTFLPERTGGLEVSTNELCIALKSIGVKISVLCSGNYYGTIINNSDSPFGLSVDNELGYPVYRARDPARSLPIVTSREEADFVVIHLDRKFELADSAKSLKISTIFYLRDVQFETKFWNLRTFSNATFVANSDFTAFRAEHEFGIKCKVIHPLIDAEKYRTVRAGKLITFINPVPKKGIELALRLAHQRPQYQFLFVEGWPLTNEQKEHYLTRANLLNNIVWLANQNDMRDVYSQTKILIVPSVCEEAWGRVVSEAQISGIPSIVSNRGGLPDTVARGGFVVNADDESSWLDALDRLYLDDACYAKKSAEAIDASNRIELSHTFIINSFLELLK